ncbi:hypothetical protein QJQ45_023687, partial [Haematococcus lacustris]
TKWGVSAAAAGVLLWRRDLNVAWALLGAIVNLAVCKSWLRVSSGYHTMAQVSVGFALGAATAMAWERIGSTWVLPMAAQQTWLATTLVVCMGLGITAFAIKTLRGARSDVLRLQQALRKRL